MKSPYLALVILFSLFALACGSSGPGPKACDALLAGDLVITEVMANPNGTDSGNEWFEIYNATGATIDLQDITLISSRADLTSEDSHVMPSATIAAREYMVFGDVLPDFLPAHVDYGYGPDLGALGNTSGRLAIFCGSNEIDNMLYETNASGLAKGLTGSITPDYIANDTLTNWCDATVEYMAMGFFGSPGSANENCPGPQGTCDEGGTIRNVNKPVVGDLVITELLPNPNAVSDTNGEWMEVLVVNSVDLNGLEVGSNPGSVASTINDPLCITVAAGTYLIFARDLDVLTNGGVTADYDLGFSLVNGGDTVFVGIDGTVLDEFTYTASATGATISLDPDLLNTTDNDNEINWCDGVTAFGDGDLGTPGGANDQCPIILNPGECDDNGTPRAIIAPTPGDLTITEYMANPNVVSDPNGEWFELTVNASFDLNDLELGRVVPTVDDNVTSVACMPVNSGDIVLFARNANNATNSGLPTVDITYGFALLNSNGGLFVASGGTVIDSVTWTSSTAGASTQLDPGGIVWCPGMTAYGDGDNMGTPATANETCP